MYISPQLSEGIGQLLCEMCRGVSQQFHSCTATVLPLLLSRLATGQCSSEQVFQALSKLIQLMAGYTRREFSEPIWKALLVR